MSAHPSHEQLVLAETKARDRDTPMEKEEPSKRPGFLDSIGWEQKWTDYLERHCLDEFFFFVLQKIKVLKRRKMLNVAEIDIEQCARSHEAQFSEWYAPAQALAYIWATREGTISDPIDYEEYLYLSRHDPKRKVIHPKNHTEIPAAAERIWGIATAFIDPVKFRETFVLRFDEKRKHYKIGTYLQFMSFYMEDLLADGPRGGPDDDDEYEYDSDDARDPPKHLRSYPWLFPYKWCKDPDEVFLRKYIYPEERRSIDAFLAKTQ